MTFHKLLTVAATFGLGLALAGPLAGSDRPPDPEDDDFSFGGDEVGTLPSVKGGSACDRWSLRPSLVLVGAEADVATLLQDVQGQAGYQFERAGDTGLARAVFCGQPMLTLDRSRLDALDVQIALEVGPLFAGGLSVASWDGVTSRPGVLPVGGDLPLAVGAIAESGALEVAPLSLHLFSPDRLHARVEVRALGNQVLVGLSQR